MSGLLRRVDALLSEIKAKTRNYHFTFVGDNKALESLNKQAQEAPNDLFVMVMLYDNPNSMVDI